jgi:hypothetical protein
MTKPNVTELNSEIQNLLIKGDTLFGDDTLNEATKEAKERNKELLEEKSKIKSEIETNEVLKRDFVDLKESLPEIQEKKVLHFIDDYTLAFLCISYLFMGISLCYFSIIYFGGGWSVVIKSIITTLVTTVLGLVLLYQLC